MTTSQGLYRGTVRVLSAIFILLGVTLVGVTLAAGGGPLSTGVLLGALFAAVGAGRLWLATRVDR